MPASNNHARQLGVDGPMLPPVGFGVMGLAGVYGDIPSEAESFAVLDRALELGMTHWDTADIYGFNDELLAKWFKRTGARSSIFLASKFGIEMERGTTNFTGINSGGDYCKKACYHSLERLGIDQLDLYYAHRIHPAIPIEETMRAMSELQAEGKIKHIGLCGADSNTLRRASKIARVACVQVEYSPFVRTIETEESTNLMETCRELGIAIVCSSPLGRGLLTGRFNTSADLGGGLDIRSKQMPRFHSDNIEANAKVIREFEKLAKKKNCTTSQLALAWILKQGNDLFVIPGTRKVQYLEDNWAAQEIDLTDEEEREVRQFVADHQLQGDAETASGKRFNFVDTAPESN